MEAGKNPKTTDLMTMPQAAGKICLILMGEIRNFMEYCKNLKFAGCY